MFESQSSDPFCKLLTFRRQTNTNKKLLFLYTITTTTITRALIFARPLLLLFGTIWFVSNCQAFSYLLVNSKQTKNMFFVKTNSIFQIQVSNQNLTTSQHAKCKFKRQVLFLCSIALSFFYAPFSNLPHLYSYEQTHLPITTNFAGCFKLGAHLIIGLARLALKKEQPTVTIDWCYCSSVFCVCVCVTLLLFAVCFANVTNLQSLPLSIATLHLAAFSLFLHKTQVWRSFLIFIFFYFIFISSFFFLSKA